MKREKWTLWRHIALLVGVLIYNEVVFRLSTVGGLFNSGTVCMVLFSCVYGCVAALLLALLPGEKSRRAVTAVLMFVTAVLFLIEYFIYYQFKVFYDLTTSFAGANDALSNYFMEVVYMVCSFSGILRIVLFLLPPVLFLCFRKRLLIGPKRNWKQMLIALCAAVVVFLGSLLGVYASPVLKSAWRTKYTFQGAVSNFGFITGLGLDIRQICVGTTGELELDATIPQVEVTEPTTPPTTPPPQDTDPADPTEPMEPTEPPTEPVIEYGVNALDIDYASLEASGTIAKLNAYVASQTPSSQHQYTGLFEGKNLIFITAEAFCMEAIDPELTPTLYRLATTGMQFTDYYQFSGAGTTGGEYQNVFGMVPTSSGASFKMTSTHLNAYTMGSFLNERGYYGQAFHNNDSTYYSRHKTHNNIGYSEGFMGYGSGMEKYVANTWPQSDLEMFQGTMPLYIEQQPFNVYYMTVSGHSSYYPDYNYICGKNWDQVKDLEGSRLVRGYYSTQLELEYSLAYILEQLEAYGIMDDTVICLTADHFPYGLDDDAALGKMPYLSELYGYKVVNSFQRDHSGWLLWSGCLEDMEPIVVDEPTCSLDILPTLANLFGIEYDSRLMVGRDVLSDAPALIFSINYDWKTPYGTYYANTGKFVQTDPDMTLPEGYEESIHAIVRNKMYYCSAVLKTDYFRYLFEEKE